jgi:hypothetical protein
MVVYWSRQADYSSMCQLPNHHKPEPRGDGVHWVTRVLTS